MKIGMFLDTSFPPDTRVENEAVSLIDSGHEVHLFSINYEDVKDYEIINGIHIHRYRFCKIVYKLSALAYTFPFYHLIIEKSIRSFLKNVNPDVLHIHDMPVAQAVLKINGGTLPVVLDLHENRPEIMIYYRHTRTIIGRLLISINKWRKKQNEFISKADKVIVVTEESKNDIISKGIKNAEDIIVVPNTIHPKLFLRYSIDHKLIERYKNTFNILYVGDTGLRRGTDDLIKAAVELKGKINNLNIIIVGSSSEDHILHELAQQLNVEDAIVFEGWQDFSLFPTYIMASQICVSPLKRNLHHDSTFANKIFQYMSMGVPVVVSDCTAQANLVKEEKCGLIHKAGDIENLSSQILALYKNSELRKKLGVNGKRAVETKWNWKVTSEELIIMYRNGFNTLHE